MLVCLKDKRRRKCSPHGVPDRNSTRKLNYSFFFFTSYSEFQAVSAATRAGRRKESSRAPTVEEGGQTRGILLILIICIHCYSLSLLRLSFIDIRCGHLLFIFICYYYQLCQVISCHYASTSFSCDCIPSQVYVIHF